MASNPVPALATQAPIAVIGAGTMGAGIAQLAAAAGHTVYLYDLVPAALERALQTMQQSQQRLFDKGASSVDGATLMTRVVATSDMTPLVPAKLVIEAIVEDLEIKADLLRKVEAVVASDAILASNTSSLSITALAARMQRPAQVVGMHFFNPPVLMPLVEVVSGAATDGAVAATIFATALAWNKRPVHCKSTPGFIVNRIARPYYGEALRLLSEGAADVASIDVLLREAGGFRMGPFELMDLIGHDVNYAVSVSVYEAFYFDPRFKPSLLQKDLVDAGWLGRKSGRGFYTYPAPVEQVATCDAKPGQTPIQIIIEGDLGPATVLAQLCQTAGLPVQMQDTGSNFLRIDGLALMLTDGRSATAVSAQIGEPVVLFDLALDYATAKRVAIALPDQYEPQREAIAAKASGFFRALGKQVTFIDDVPGMIVMRTVAMLVNEAVEVLNQRLATAADIDLAMENGVNYPRGPLAWGDAIGAQRVCTVLQNLSAAYGEDRYRVAQHLRRLALTQRSLREDLP